MTATGHALIGTALAVSIPNPVIGIPLAILSHIAADAFPHWDTGYGRRKKPFTTFFAESLFDLFLSFFLPFIIVYFFFPETNYMYLYTMVIAAQLFDWLTAPYIFLNLKKFPFDLPYKFQIKFDNPIGLPWGLVGQVAVVGALLIGAYYFTTESRAATESAAPEDEMTFCTMDAKLCPDGSSVGRVGPNCEFAPCPGN